jgi:hypothetical protein
LCLDSSFGKRRRIPDAFTIIDVLKKEKVPSFDELFLNPKS